MFSGLLAKATAALGIVVAFLLAMLKYKDVKLENAEEKNKMHDKENEIIDDMNLAKVKAKANENKAKDNIDDSDWRDNI